MEFSLYDTDNSIHLWMKIGHSNAVLDEEDTESDTPLPSSIMAGGTREKLVEWTKNNVRDTHVG
jgi:hypothetical protein